MRMVMYFDTIKGQMITVDFCYTVVTLIAARWTTWKIY